MTAPVLIVALDVPSLPAALQMVERLRQAVGWFKVGSILFTAAGPDAVRAVRATGASVFLDLKFHDIPQVVGGGVAAAVDLGASLVTMHCAAGPDAMRAASDAARRAGGSGTISVLGVTRLTSEGGRLGAAVLRAAQEARDAGLDGVTAAVRDVRRIKARCGRDFRVLTPGIRPAGSSAFDQVRVATPREAVRAGSDYVVVGRPIIAAPDPLAAARDVLEELERGAGPTPATAGPLGTPVRP